MFNDCFECSSTNQNIVIYKCNLFIFHYVPLQKTNKKKRHEKQIRLEWDTTMPESNTGQITLDGS